MISKKYQGVVVPAVTPLTRAFTLDHQAVERMFSNFNDHQVMPFILGTTGEAASLPLSLKQEYVGLASSLKKDNTVLYAGISSNCLDESVEFARFCFDNGVDVVAATLPTYYMLAEDQMRRYFEELVEQVPGPVIIYNIPATTHMSVPLDLIDELSHHEKLVGTKDSERNEERLARSLELWASRPDFSHFLGWAGRSAYALIHGSDGLIPSTGNLYPGLYEDIWNAARNGDREKAFEGQDLSDKLGDLYQSGRTLGESLWSLKWLMKQAGICEAYVMPPLRELSETHEVDLIRGLEELMDIKKTKIV